jgi:hypothetical protein
MGTFLGVRTEYKPFWEEREELSDLEKMYHVGYEDGYDEGSEDRERLKTLEQENESLRGLLGANIRVIREEIKKQIRDQDLQTIKES